MMTVFEVRVFEVPRLAMGVQFMPAKHTPVELAVMTVEGASIEEARTALEATLAKLGKDVRAINVGPNPAGRPSFIVYLHGKTLES